MIWSRRSFLVASATLAGGLAVSFVPKAAADQVAITPTKAKRGIVSAGNDDLYLLFMDFYPVGDTPQPVVIECGGVPLFAAMCVPHQQTHVQVDGQIVVPHGYSLYNASDSDVKIRCAFTNARGDAWLIDDAGVRNLRATR